MALSGRIVSAALFFAAALVPCQGATVSVLVAETGLDGQSPEATSAWESGLMDALFNAGHIVSNAPVLRLGAGDEILSWQPSDRELTEAIAGGADHLMVAILAYPADARADVADKNAALVKPRTAPARVLVRLYSLEPFAEVGESLADYPDRSESGTEDQARARTLAQSLIRILKDR